jgi:APA family basic amino acid/polyamine antiporter
MTTKTRNAPLLRQIGLVSATALVISNMVGTGIFTTTGFLAGDLGDVKLVILIWVVGAICALAGAFCYSELGINFPSSGGEYVYLTEAYGPTWGFMTGWVSFFAGFSAPIALAALAFSDYVGYFWPAARLDHSVAAGPSWFPLQIGWAQLVACALISMFTLLNFFGVKRVARIQNVLTGTKVFVLLAFIVLGFLVGNGDWNNFSMNATRTSTTPIGEQFAYSLLFIYLSYSGWNAATYVAEEVHQPERTLPIALTFGTILVAGLFIALNLVFIYAQPLEQLKGKVAVGWISASHLFGPEIGGLFGALMALAIMSTVNAMVTIGPRIYYAMAQNGAFFSIAARVNERWHTPVPAILMQGVCALFMTMTSFRDLFFFIGFLLNFFAAVSVTTLFRFRKRPGWQKLPAVSFAWPFVPLLFVVVSVWLTYKGMMMNPKVSGVAVALVLAGAAFYRNSDLSKKRA